MRTVTTTKNIYTFDELTEQAKENAKQWYLGGAEFRTDDFYEQIRYDLTHDFPNSDLDVCFSLSYCQGDGLNIFGKINLFDFLKVWKADEKSKRTMKFYLEQSYLYYYEFENDYRYCYSCKFLDRKSIDYTINDFVNSLEYFRIRAVNRDVIEQFYNDMIDYFEELDEQYEKDGYEYIYEIDDGEMSEVCEMNGYEFDEDGYPA